MKKLHLHIGSPKTGSTSVQEILNENRKELKKQGFNYSGNEIDHHQFFFATKSQEKDWPRHFKGLNKESLKININKYFASLESDFPSDHQHIISTEYLFIDTEEYIENVIRYLEKFFSEIKVYLFVRPPVEYFRSFQQQLLKAQSFIVSPNTFRYNFKSVIEGWQKFCNVEVLEYKKGRNSFEVLCSEIGINSHELSQVNHRTKRSTSIEQMALLEKIQRNLYPIHDNKLVGKLHLKIIPQINAPFTSKPKLQEWVKPVIYENHHEDLEWLKNEYRIDFLKEYLHNNPSSLPVFENGQASVRDVYRIDNEHLVERYEALVIDVLLKQLAKR